MSKPLSEWATGGLMSFIRDELDGSMWSHDLSPGVQFRDVIAEALRRCDEDLHIVTSADKNVLEAALTPFGIGGKSAREEWEYRLFSAIDERNKTKA